MTELGFQYFAFGDVGDKTIIGHDTILIVLANDRGILYPPDSAILVDDTVLKGRSFS